jgi:DNA-binding HxlR family transcriptional regulator
VLTERLKGLEAHGLVTRMRGSGHPVRLRYALTGGRASLRPLSEALYSWGERAAADLNVRIRSPAARE